MGTLKTLDTLVGEIACSLEQAHGSRGMEGEWKQVDRTFDRLGFARIADELDDLEKKVQLLWIRSKGEWRPRSFYELQDVHVGRDLMFMLGMQLQEILTFLRTYAGMTNDSIYSANKKIDYRYPFMKQDFPDGKAGPIMTVVNKTANELDFRETPYVKPTREALMKLFRGSCNLTRIAYSINDDRMVASGFYAAKPASMIDPPLPPSRIEMLQRRAISIEAQLEGTKEFYITDIGLAGNFKIDDVAFSMALDILGEAAHRRRLVRFALQSPPSP